MEGLWRHLPDYSKWVWQTYLFYALFGLLGGLLRIIQSPSGILLPTRTKDGFLKLNAVGIAISAGILGMLVDHNPLLATLCGVVAFEIVSTVINLGVAIVKVAGGRGIRALLLQWLEEQYGHRSSE